MLNKTRSYCSTTLDITIETVKSKLKGEERAHHQFMFKHDMLLKNLKPLKLIF